MTVKSESLCAQSLKLIGHNFGASCLLKSCHVHLFRLTPYSLGCGASCDSSDILA